MKDLFEKVEKLPRRVQAMLDRFNEEGYTYDTCKKYLMLFIQEGYRFEFGLDAVPFNLKKCKSKGYKKASLDGCERWESMFNFD